MARFKFSICLILLILIVSACGTPLTTSSPSQSEPSDAQPVEATATESADLPTPFPDTPAPAAIDAALVEAPALVSLDFLNELDGWGVTETQIVRTNDGGVTWYNVTPPDVAEAGFGVSMFVLDN